MVKMDAQNVPEFCSIHTRVRPSNGPAPLSEIPLSIAETTGDFGSLAGLAFCFWSGLEALNFLEATVGRMVDGRIGKTREVWAYQLSQEVTSLGRFLWP